MKTRYRLYLETSFWKRLGDAAYHSRRRLSYRFLRQVESRHDLFISNLVHGEVMGTPDLVERRHVLRRIKSVHPRTVTNSRKAERQALELLDSGGWEDGLLADMLHVAYTIQAGCDALVTWDQDDLARDKTRNVVQAFGRRTGVSAPLIGTPEEVAEWLGIRIRS